MQVYGPAYLHGAQAINSPHTNRAAQPTSAAATTATPTDELQLSDAGQIASRLADIPDIRADKVASAKAAIANGSYETSDKLDVALSRLLDEIG
ncbi:MAG TPA: flagellar biosynthesis anti-sigma factor FlgM [Pirellulales bacterium]|nr:flagellar biosynthesis anti-sigma factor FlgM [Pirellulales bacterium]